MSNVATDLPEELEPLWTTERVSAFLGVPAGTLAQWRATGREPDLPFLRIGGHVRYRPADVRRLVNNRVRQPGKAGGKQAGGVS